MGKHNNNNKEAKPTPQTNKLTKNQKKNLRRQHMVVPNKLIELIILDTPKKMYGNQQKINGNT